MSVSRCLLVNRAAQVEHLDNPCGAQVEVLFNELFNACLVDFGCAEAFDANADGIGDADGIGKLNFAFVCQACRHNIFRNVARRISSRAVNLRGVFAAEGSAAVPRPAAVGVDDYFSARQAAVALRPADNELARRIDEKFCLGRQKLGGDDGLNDVFNHVALNLFKRHVGVVLGGNDNRIDGNGLAAFVGDGDLRFAVGAQIVNLVRDFADFSQTAGKLMGKRYGQRHEFGRFVGRVAEHHALVARADSVFNGHIAFARLNGFVDALRDVGRLFVQGNEHADGLGVEAVSRIGVADVANRAANDFCYVDVASRGNFSDDVNLPCRHQRFASHAPDGVFSDDCVQDAV